MCALPSGHGRRRAGLPGLPRRRAVARPAQPRRRPGHPPARRRPDRRAGPGTVARRRPPPGSTAVAAAVADRPRPRVAVVEWVDPPFTAGHWVPDLVRAAGGEPVGARPAEPAPCTPPGSDSRTRPDVVIVAPCGFHLDGAADQAESVLARLPDASRCGPSTPTASSCDPARGSSTVSRRSPGSCTRRPYAHRRPAPCVACADRSACPGRAAGTRRHRRVRRARRRPARRGRAHAGRVRRRPPPGQRRHDGLAGRAGQRAVGHGPAGRCRRRTDRVGADRPTSGSPRPARRRSPRPGRRRSAVSGRCTRGRRAP